MFTSRLAFWGRNDVYVAPAADYIIDLTNAALPAGSTFTRNNTLSTYRDSSFKLRRAVANVPRWDYDANGAAFLREPSRVNKFTGHIVPTVTTGFSVSGTATIALVADATALTTANLEQTITGNVYSVSGGVSGGRVTLAGTTAAVTNHSMSVWARVVSGSPCSFTHTGTSPGVAAISSAAYSRIKLENQVISATTVQMAIDVPANTEIRFTLAQLEAWPQITTEIVTLGATGTTVADVLNIALSSYPGIQNSVGAALMLCEYTSRGIAQAQALSINNGSNTDYLSIQEGNSRLAVLCRRTNTVISSGISLITPDRYVPYGIGMTWKPNLVNFMCGPALNRPTALTGALPAAATTLSIGGSSLGNVESCMRIKKVYLWKGYVDPWVLGRYMFDATWKMPITGGQSLQYCDASSQPDSLPDGERAFNAVLDSVFPATKGKNVEAHAAISGNGLLKKSSTGQGYYYDDVSGTWGLTFYSTEQTIRAIKLGGGSIPFMAYSGHENDSYLMNVGQLTKADYKKYFMILINKVRALAGNIPIILEPLGRRIDNASFDLGFQLMHEAQVELARENPTVIYLGPEKVDLDIPSNDTVHMTTAAQAIKAGRMARKGLSVTGDITGQNVDGPKIASVVKSGLNLTVTATLDTLETAILPTIGISGFRFFDGLNEIAITGSIATAGVITLTLATAPNNANQTLYLGYGGMFAEKAFIAQYPKGNGPNALPMSRSKWISSNAGNTFTEA